MANERIFTEDAPARRNYRTLRLIGYCTAIVVNAALLVIVNRFIHWESVPFLTPAFTSTLWLLSLSLAATAVANYFFIVNERAWVNALAQFFLSGLALIFLVRLLTLFPFDFSMYTGFDWTQAVRISLIVLVVLVSLVALAELGRFVAVLTRGNK